MIISVFVVGLATSRDHPLVRLLCRTKSQDKGNIDVGIVLHCPTQLQSFDSVGETEHGLNIVRVLGWDSTHGAVTSPVTLYSGVAIHPITRRGVVTMQMLTLQAVAKPGSASASASTAIDFSAGNGVVSGAKFPAQASYWFLQQWHLKSKRLWKYLVVDSDDSQRLAATQHLLDSLQTFLQTELVPLLKQLAACKTSIERVAAWGQQLHPGFCSLRSCLSRGQQFLAATGGFNDDALLRWEGALTSDVATLQTMCEHGRATTYPQLIQTSEQLLKRWAPRVLPNSVLARLLVHLSRRVFVCTFHVLKAIGAKLRPLITALPARVTAPESIRVEAPDPSTAATIQPVLNSTGALDSSPVRDMHDGNGDDDDDDDEGFHTTRAKGARRRGGGKGSRGGSSVRRGGCAAPGRDLPQPAPVDTPLGDPPPPPVSDAPLRGLDSLIAVLSGDGTADVPAESTHIWSCMYLCFCDLVYARTKAKFDELWAALKELLGRICAPAVEYLEKEWVHPDKTRQWAHYARPSDLIDTHTTNAVESLHNHIKTFLLHAYRVSDPLVLIWRLIGDPHLIITRSSCLMARMQRTGDATCHTPYNTAREHYNRETMWFRGFPAN